MYSSTSPENQVLIVEAFSQLNQTEDYEIKYTYLVTPDTGSGRTQPTKVIQLGILLRLPTKVYFRIRTQGIHIKVQT